MRTRHLLVLILIAALVALIGFSTVSVARASARAELRRAVVPPAALCTGSVDPVCSAVEGSVLRVAQLASCGDGICDPYAGENQTTCPADCPSPPPAATATQISVETNAPVPAATTGAVARPTSTPVRTATIAAAATVALTRTPPPSVTPSETPFGAVCGFESYEEQTAAWRDSYGGQTIAGFIPTLIDNNEILVCRVPPTGTVCIETYVGLLQAANNDLSRVALVDCTPIGQCRIVDEPAVLSADRICFNITPTNNITCAGGCALIVKKAAGGAGPVISQLNVPQAVVIPAIIFLAAVGIGLVLFAVLLIRARRPLIGTASRREDDEEEEPL